MPSSHLILGRPFLLLPPILPSMSLFQWVNSSHEVVKVLEFQLQHHSLQRNPRVDLLQNGLVGSPCRPRDSQESSPTPQFKSINSLALRLFHSPTLTFIHDHRKNHSQCVGTWNVRSMNQAKLEVVKQEMAKMNIDILGISKLKWTGMDEFNSDDHSYLSSAACPLGFYTHPTCTSDSVDDFGSSFTEQKEGRGRKLPPGPSLVSQSLAMWPPTLHIFLLLEKCLFGSPKHSIFPQADQASH